jgi:hypothetical protein
MGLAELIELKRKESWNGHASDSEVLGVLIASHFQWDGRQCFDTLSYALEDSNFHRVNRALSATWDSVEGKS